jgi:tungstate transport system substrate-binding protein
MCVVTAACGSPPTRLGTTFTLEQSGALTGMDSAWQGDRFVTVIGPSGQILRSAAAGDLDVVVTHAPALEQRWLGEPGRASLTCPLFASRFIIVGPPADPAGIRGITSGVDAMRRIGRVGAVFVSRGDSSGTHEKERELWRLAGVETGPALWYIESGASQAANLQQASNWRAYALTDLPTFALLKQRRADALDLETLVAPPGDTLLTNPYTLYVTAPPQREARARPFAEWLATVWRTRVLEMRVPGGEPAFVPREGGCTAGEAGSAKGEESTVSGPR